MEKDIIEKSLISYNEVFADIVNVLLFDGEEIIKEDELIDAIAVSNYKADSRIHLQERDVAKYWNNKNIRIAFIGIENQSTPYKYMPLRVIGYDGANYRNQLSENKNQDIYYPILTLILYFGYERRWNYPKNLFSCLNVPEILKPFINDYKINVFEIAFLDEDKIKKFKSDFRVVAEYFYQSRTRADYAPTDVTIKHVYEVLSLLSLISGNKNFIESYDANIEKESKGGMMAMDLLQNMLIKSEQKGLDKGISQGISQGITQGISQGEDRISDLINLLLKEGKSDEVLKITTDKKRREELYRKYNIL